MNTRYDREAGRLTTGIGDLIAWARLPDTLVPDGGGAPDLQARQRVHSAYQRRLAAGGFDVEVPLSLELEVLGITFDLRGRADLVRRTASGIELIEVKTASRRPDPGHPMLTRSRHVLQLYFYLQALAGDVPVSAALVYLSMDGSPPGEQRVDIDPDDPLVEEAWSEMLEWTARTLLAEEARRREQERALGGDIFPYEARRPGQEQMTAAVRGALSAGRNLMLQAPTGTGKTAAVLEGALRAVLPDRGVLFFLTAKGTQRHMAEETVRLTAERGLPLRAVTLTARERVCMRGRPRCLPDDCPWAERFGESVRASGVREELLGETVVGREELVRAAERSGACPFELGLCMTGHADIVVCDYNYVFDPHVYLRRFFGEPAAASRCRLLMDEAANLPERARDWFSPTVSRSLVERLLREGGGGHARLLAPLLEPWLARLREWEALLADDGDGRREMLLPDDTPLPLSEEGWMEVLASAEDPSMDLMEMALAVFDMSRIDGPGDDRYHLVLDAGEDDLSVQWFCSDPSLQLSERVGSCSGCVAFSATLEPMDHYRPLLGLPEDTPGVSVPYPFPPENLGVWLDRTVDTRYRRREATLDALCSRLVQLLDAVPGAWLVFMPSFGYLRNLRELLEGAGVPVLAQERAMAPEMRERFLSKLSSWEGAALTVSGGIFSEGVDIRSDSLRGAVVAGPSLPGVDLRRRLLSERYESTGRSGFLHAWAIPGMTRVVQAAGRLVRSGTQRRALVLAGDRFACRPYLGLLPKHWFGEEGLPVLGRDVDGIVRFFREEGGR